MADKNEYIYDEVTGAKGKKKAMSLLNQRELSIQEMDELFMGDY